MTFFTTADTLVNIKNIEEDESVIYIPEGITAINPHVLEKSEDRKIEKIVFPRSLKVINPYAFFDNNIMHIDLTACSNLELIGARAFADVPLKNLTLNGSKLKVDAFAFCSGAYLSPLKPKERGGQLENLDLGNVEIVDAFAFCGQRKIKELDIPSSLKRIEAHSFSNCKQLEKLTIGQFVDFIDTSAFINTKIKTVEIGPFTKVAKDAFDRDVNIIKVV